MTNDSELRGEIAREYASRSTILYRERRSYHAWKENILYVEAEALLSLREYGNAKRVKGLLETCTRAVGLWLVQRNGQDWDEQDLFKIANNALQSI